MRDPLQPLQNTPATATSDAMPSPVKASMPVDCHVDDSAHDGARESLASSPAQQHTATYYPHSPPYEGSPSRRALSPSKRSPVKYRLQDESIAMDSPPDSPAQSTVRLNEGLTRAAGQLQNEAAARKTSTNNTVLNEGMSTIMQEQDADKENHHRDAGDTIDFDITLGFDKTTHEETVGDLSTISAIPTDLTRFANPRSPPTVTIPTDGWTPRPSRNSMVAATPATGQRPLHLLSRRSTSSNEDEEATPRRARHSADSSNDLMTFAGPTNILFPPPGPTPRTARRSPSGRGAFPIRVNPTPNHRSQASVDRERATGRSPQKTLPDQSVPATPASARNSMQSSTNGFALDLLDIDLGPTATPRSIPTVTPRELETLRSELQSRISGLEATLSGKEAEVNALKKAITDAEVRAGKSSEEARVERQEKEEAQTQRDDLDRRAREMEEVLREVKQNAFVEEREREKLKRQAEEAEKRTEECEVKVLELNASLDTLRSERVRASPGPIKASHEPSTPGSGSPVDVDAAVKNAAETVARELHALYKSKHERKVADLKLSYEKRWSKQVEQLKAELEDEKKEVSRLTTERDATMTGMMMPGQGEALSRMEGQIEELRRWNEDLSAQKKVTEAELAGVRSELEAVRRDNEHLRVDLESERSEKGELVAQVEVFLSVSAEQEREREVEREAREARERDRQPVSPPRSDASGDSTTGGGSSSSSGNGNGNSSSNGNSNGNSNNFVQMQSPSKPRMNGSVGANGRARPMSMLAKPTATKFGSGIPALGASGLKAPSTGPARPTVYGRGGSLMDGINRMGAGNR